MNTIIEVVTESIEHGFDQNYVYKQILSKLGFFA
jgi:hypothetical protein